MDRLYWFPTVLLALSLCACARPSRRSPHHFVSLGIKDLPLILMDQDTGKVCYAGSSPAASAYLEWYTSNVGPITEDKPMYCSDVVWLSEGAKVK